MKIGRFGTWVLLPLFVGAPLALGCGGASAESPGSTQETSGLVGQKAPNFSVAAVAGSKGTVSIANLRGKVVLIDFWATFCEPCKKSFPRLQDLNSKYDASGLKIVGISEDEAEDKDKITDFARAYGAKFTLAWDGDKAVAQSYKPATMPSSFLIDKMGVVRFAHVGYHDGDAALLDKEIQGLLQR
jgi:cytochrome c biogenesis protein CcmG/thiol:disulfide interchange protein DsbE